MLLWQTMVESSIKQFCEGLGPMYDQVKRSPGATAQLFVYTNNNLRKADLKKTYTITYSLEGSNNRTQEEDTMYSFETFLLECEANSTGVSLSEVLEFWIGAEDIPPYGFQMPLLIDFYSTTPGIRHLPSAHTFMPVLWLPGVLEILMI
ncbi:uncharacterized protein LOC110984172 [Acanthaster planci]|uniref:Uncharacterized protein LOC110984172 n=1 Tax=Acanthaster planci TaxID=133434 RepID=A0A8B7Z458_ACAPL|nr:uncharacterized protein LOC110984172 [Acanthaster planci]